MKSGTWMWSTAMCLFAALAITIQTSAQSQMITLDCFHGRLTHISVIQVPGSNATYAEGMRMPVNS